MTSRETGHEPEAREVPPPRRWQLTGIASLRVVGFPG